MLHAGYEALLRREADAAGVLLLGRSFGNLFPVIGKDIRALDPAVAAGYVRATHPLPVEVVEVPEVGAAVTGDELVVPDEALMRDVVERFDLAAGRSVRWERTFLRWDRAWSQAQRPASFDGTVGTDALSVSLTRQAQAEAGLSSDWWRQVGAVAVRGEEVLAAAHNEHRPTAYTPYVDGDPRDDFRRGVRADLSTAIHAEAALIARAAAHGLALRGADLYVSTFPCPACARLIGEAGFRRCFFAGPYAVLDGDAVLRAAGVELIWVDVAGDAAGA